MRQEEIDRAEQFWDQFDADKARDVSWTAIPYFEEQSARRLTKRVGGGNTSIGECFRVVRMGDADESSSRG